MNNRGNVTDIMWIAIILFVVAIGIFVVVTIGHTVISGISAVPSVANNTEAIKVLVSGQDAIDLSDYIYLAGFVGFFISLMIFAYFVGGYPVMSIIYFILLIIFGFISVILQLVWTYIVSQSTYTSTTLDIPITNFIMLHLAYFMVIFGLISMTIMYSKSTQ